MESKLMVEQVFSCINSIIERYAGSKNRAGVVKRFRARARSLPQEVFSRGLAYTLVYIAARSSRDAVERGLEEKITECRDVVNSVGELADKTNMGEEELSYALYGAVILYLAKRLGIVKLNRLESIVCEALNNVVLEVKMWPVIDWLKRVAEAYISE
ncbi:MAG: type III-B CRISPR module-associated protein Cmr5 [Ignisphaera sp.]|nr:type III-B CRISPR module-associated protein Cmr5 [Ignisphaera sp.]MDW8086331.1 type III-B CRISPR module-associated protein Cmr5 [Ignisphaera sp.]